MYHTKEIINNWDPIDLLCCCPDDEYRSEIEQIDQLICQTGDFIVLSEGIYKIFIEAFGEDIFKKSKSECEMIAQMLLSKKEFKSINFIS